MLTKRKTMKQQLKKEDGFTLVEVIAVLVILGILAAVAIPKFFDMQSTARDKAAEGAVGELNGQVALAFAQAALNGNPSGEYDGFTGFLGPDFTVEIPVGTPTTAGTEIDPPEAGTIQLASGGSAYTINWTDVANDGSPGFFTLVIP